MMDTEKTYLGDGVYVEKWFDTGAVILTTFDGFKDTNGIFLEPEVLKALFRYIAGGAK